MTPEITSTSNPLIKRIRKLRQRKHRDEEGAFFVEGIRPVWSALSSGADIESLVVAPDLLRSSEARGLVQDSPHHVTTLSVDVFESIAERENPSGLGALVRSSYVALDGITLGGDSLVIALEDVGNPGNLGTILRTADAAGVAAVIVAGESTDPFHPTAVKASMGSLFTVPIAGVDSIEDAIEWARSNDLPVVATSARASTDLWASDVAPPALVLFGSEATGLDQQVIDSADVALRIPMKGDSSSLNLAVAAGIVLFELARRNGG